MLKDEGYQFMAAAFEVYNQLGYGMAEEIYQQSLEIELELGSLPPVTEITGVQARLNNLGFGCGTVDGDIGPRTRAALRRFQARNELPVTGEIDAATRTRLRQAHDGE